MAGLDVHCIRKEEWKLRVAQGTEGEIYMNDSTTGAKASAWLQVPELVNMWRWIWPRATTWRRCIRRL